MDWLGRGPRRLGVAIVVASSLIAAGSASAATPTQIVRTAPIATGPMNPFGRLGDDTVTSTNWSGYAVAAASKFTDVRGSWVEPAVACNVLLPRYSSFWAGIDGYSSASVEQLGTDSDCTSYDHPSYYAWYEMYPAGSVDIPTGTYPVKPGDTLSAEVSVSGSSYTLSLRSSEGWTFSITKVQAGLADSSAEMVAESPEICGLILCRTAMLPDFGTVSFTGVEAAVSGGADAGFDTFTATSGPHDIVGETSASAIRALPTALTPSAGGDAFSIAWKHA